MSEENMFTPEQTEELNKLAEEINKEPEKYQYTWNDEKTDRTIHYDTVMSVFRNTMNITFMLNKNKQECVVVEEIDQDLKFSVKFTKKDIGKYIEELQTVYDSMTD